MAVAVGLPDEAIQVLGDTLTVAVGRPEGMRSVVEAMVGAVFDFADSHPRSAALLAGAGVAEEPSAQRMAHRAAAVCTDTLTRALAPYCTPRADHGWLVATELVAIARSCARDWAVTGKPLPRDDAVTTTASLCWTGLAGVRLASEHPGPTGAGCTHPTPWHSRPGSPGQSPPVPASVLTMPGNRDPSQQREHAQAVHDVVAIS